VDLLALVPCVLGFHPEESLVMVVVAGEGPNLHARVDLPLDEESTELVVATLVNAVHRADATRTALIAYTHDHARARAITVRLATALEQRDVGVSLAIRADGERWYSLDCDLDAHDPAHDPARDPAGGCCPPDGWPYDLSTHPFTAEAVLEGQVTYRNREALADSLVGTDLAAVDAVAEAAEESARRRSVVTRGPRRPAQAGDPEQAGPLERDDLVVEGEWVRGRVRRFATSGEPLDHDEVGRLLVAVADVEVRDVAWAEMTREGAAVHVDLWREVVRRAPHEWMAAPAALLAFAAWLAGDGALAWCAVERCQEADPDYSLARLVAETLEAAVPPTTWQPIPPQSLGLFAG
jgi:hypothetical protein